MYSTFNELVAKLSLGDDKLRGEMLGEVNPGDNTSACYREATTELDKHCIGRQVERALFTFS